MKGPATTAQEMVAPGKGILAMDESTATCNKRFAALGIEESEEQRRRYRQLLVTTPGLSEFISGAILYDETIRQSTDDGRPFPQVLSDAGILPGIKVDTGAKNLAAHPGEKVTEGLTGLRERLADYVELGARFAKWRGVIAIGSARPSRGCVDANAHALARYAALCQEAGLTPIVEPEVLMDGDHSIETCREVSLRVLDRVVAELRAQRVELSGIVLKPNMILPGSESGEEPSLEEVARATVGWLAEVVPPAVPGIAFLSGGQSDEEATERLDAMNRLFPEAPWRLTFSYGRALQRPALEAWRGRPENVEAGQEKLLHRARLNSAATQGAYDAGMDDAA
jgi:fructose-bisphosphate aldolase class I